MFKQLLPLVALLPNLISAQDVIPFSLDGALQNPIADSADFNTGGSIEVNGVKVIIPKNLQFQFPAAWVGMKEIAAGGFAGNEVAVFGNYVNGKAIAGIVQTAQFALQFSSGIIDTLGTDGKITLKGGQVVRINDPNAVFSAGYDKHPAFTADDINPSVTAFSGFPMCVPRSASDELCPQSNRPGGSNSYTAPDAMVAAPLRPGDYLEIEGIQVGSEIIAYAITAPSVQILTGENDPTYVRVEEAIMGVFDRQSANVVEFADSRVIGYTSRAGVGVTISRGEIDPCTGKIEDVTIGTANPVGARNKFTWRSGSTSLIKYAREVKATANGGAKATKLNGGKLMAGAYVAPVEEWIFPELTSPGTQPGKLDFTQMTWLRDGVGPDEDDETKIWGQLSPWPDTSAPAPFKTCDGTTPSTGTGGTGTGTDTGTGTGTGTTPSDAPVLTPTANAGADLKVRPGIVATLAGKADNAASFASGDLSYAWTQTTGSTITLTGAKAATASFTVPSSTAATSYTFELTVTSAKSGAQSKDTVVVSNDPKGVDTVTITSYTVTNNQGGTISVTAQSNVIDGSAKTMTLQLLNPNAGNALTMTSTGGGKFTYTARSTKQPSGGIRVTSGLGGVSNRTTLSQKLKRWHARMFGGSA